MAPPSVVKPPRNYHRLEADRLIETIQLLRQRIEERFPGSGLSQVCQQLLVIAKQAQERSEWISRPIRWLRVTVALLIAVIVLGLGGTIYSFLPQPSQDASRQVDSIFEVVQGLEAGLNEIVMVGVGIFFLLTFETRVKRRRALAALHELRAISHIIDMHQLTKDPERLFRDWVGTEHSPKATMGPFELRRYLDYCSEMLSLTGKIAALYVQGFDDDVALAAVNEVESLGNGLSRKIWQKIMILHSESNDALQAPQPLVPLPFPRSVLPVAPASAASESPSGEKESV